MKIFDVGFDLDDVFLHTYEALHRVCQEAGWGDTIQPTTWSPYAEYGISKEEWTEAINLAARTGFLYSDIEPDHDALRSLRELAWDGHQIHLITARGFMGEAEIIAEHTEGWLVEYAVPHHSLTYAKDKGPVAERLGLDFFIDDNEKNWRDVCDALETRYYPNETPRVYLLDRPWNQSTNTFPRERVRTVAEFVDIVKEAANRE